MTTICAIGNSHLASMVLGWRQIAAGSPGTQVVFFAARARLMRDLTVAEGLLIPGSSMLRKTMFTTHTRQEIEGNYDLFLVCGLDFGVRCACELCGICRAESHRKDGRIPISDRCFVRALQDRLNSTVAIKTIRKLRKITNAPIILIPVPLPTDGRDEAKWLSQIELNNDDREVAEQFERACDDVVREFNVDVVHQPEITKTGPLRTNHDYTRGAIRLDGGLTVAHHEDQGSHMNAQYGGIMLRAAMEYAIPKVCSS